MNNKPETNLAEILYAEGMKYNWRQNESPANAALSRRIRGQVLTSMFPAVNDFVARHASLLNRFELIPSTLIA